MRACKDSLLHKWRRYLFATYVVVLMNVFSWWEQTLQLHTRQNNKKTQFKQDSRQDIIKVLQVNSMTCICVPKSHYGINTHMKHLEEICWRFPYQQSNGFDEKHCRETLNSTSSCQVTIQPHSPLWVSTLFLSLSRHLSP